MKKDKKILICDDDPGIIDVTKMVLEECGYTVITCNSSKEVEKILQLELPKLILMDLWMPAIGGEELAKKIKGKSKTKNIPIIFVSASKDLVAIAKKTKVDGYLPKPFDIADLEAIVEQYL